MKIFTNKKRTQKIIVGLIILLLFNFIVPNYSKANDMIDWVVRPISFLFTTLFDGANYLLQLAMIGGSPDVVISEENLPDDWHKPLDEDREQLATIIFDKGDLFEGEYTVPNIEYTPAQIFSGKVAALDINFFKSETDDTMLGADTGRSSIETLRDIVASWYSALRNLAIVGLLSVLVYLAIRMIISSSNPEKAKYKQSLMDWLVALCLVFFLHYIMAFTLGMTEAFTEMITTSQGDGTKEVIIRVVSTDGELTSKPPATIEGSNLSDTDIEGNFDGINKVTTEREFTTSLLGAARFQQQYKSASKKLIYMVVYMALTIYTAMFTFTYLKRLLNMTFLTLIAPMVALTYPIDKANDGKAQAFGMWLKEYIFNALLQPLHLMIYTVLVSSAIQLAATNVLYSLAALAFILPAEKLLKAMFNFRNGQTDSSLGGFAGGMVASKMLDTFGKFGKNHSKSSSNSGNSQKIRTQDNKTNKPMKDPNAKKAGKNALMQNNFEGTGSSDNSGESGNSAIITGTGANDSTVSGNHGTAPSIIAGTDTSNWRTNSAGILVPPSANSPSPTRTSGGTGSPADVVVDGGPERLTPNAQPEPRNITGVRGTLGRYANGIRYAAGKRYTAAGGAKGIAASAGKAGLRGLGKVAKLGTKAAIGTGMASVAAAGTIVSGGKNAGAMFAGAAMATNALGNAVGNMAGNAIGSTASGVSSFVEDVRIGAGDEDAMEQKQLAKQAKDFARSTENREFFRQKMNITNKKELDEVMKQASTFYNAGVTDLDRIKEGISIENKIKNSEEFRERYSSEEERTNAAHNLAIGVSQESSKMSDDVVRDNEKFENRRVTLENVLVNSGMNKKAAEENTRKYYQLIREQRGL